MLETRDEFFGQLGKTNVVESEEIPTEEVGAMKQETDPLVSTVDGNKLNVDLQEDFAESLMT